MELPCVQCPQVRKKKKKKNIYIYIYSTMGSPDPMVDHVKGCLGFDTHNIFLSQNEYGVHMITQSRI